MITLRTVSDMRRHLRPVRRASTVGFVPTMGALHDGHAALFRAARRACGHVVASIFVNPRQFDDPADFAAYPKTGQRDTAIAEAAGVDAIFVPEVDEIYPRGDATAVTARGVAAGLEGTFRPGHFNSVATVCLKLFNIVQPHIAFFGQKDAQQAAVVLQTVADLRLDLRIEVVPTVRDPDGLAMSSRNVRLSGSERGRALAIPRALAAGLAAVASGGDPARAARAELQGLDVDYVEVSDLGGHPTLVIAARVGATRLIDNVPLDLPQLAGLTREGAPIARERSADV
jgi:pantoate--beta-alanine ligase